MKIKQYLKDLKIEYKIFSHPPLFTCEQAEIYNKNIKGIHSKNLFLKSKKNPNYYFVIIPSNKKLDLRQFETILNEKLSFAKDEELKDILGLSTGAVSPFGLINDKELKTILIINKDIWSSDYVSFHPNINTETLELTRENFQKYVISLKNKILII